MGNEIPAFGYALAAIYHCVGLLALMVAWTFSGDIWRQIHQGGDRVRDLPLRYLAAWIDWWRALPGDLRVALGRIPAKAEPQSKHGPGYPLEVGIAHTAFAWGGMALYWSEINIGWFSEMHPVGLILPIVWCWFYGRGYLLHLRTMWRAKPHRWRLFLLVMVVYIPASTALRAWLH